MIISEKAMVKVTYDLYVDAEQEGGQEELMERAPEEAPLAFCFGIGMMLPVFEANLAGKNVGDTFDFRIPCDDAYGEYEDSYVMDLDRAMFEQNGKLDEKMVFVGNVVPLMDNEGNRMNAQVVEITDKTVTVDLNHPLAGENLHFVGTVLEVREATEQELAQLLGGGCGCGCNGGGCDDHEHGGCEGGCCGGC